MKITEIKFKLNTCQPVNFPIDKSTRLVDIPVDQLPIG